MQSVFQCSMVLKLNVRRRGFFSFFGCWMREKKTLVTTRSKMMHNLLVLACDLSNSVSICSGDRALNRYEGKRLCEGIAIKKELQ